MKGSFVVALLAVTACGPAGTATLSNASEVGVAATGADVMKSTDPTTVVLASGKPQLIEFFAFW